MNRARKKIWKSVPLISLEQRIIVPSSFSKGTIRCKIIYGKEIESIDFSLYHRKRIESLILVFSDTIDYPDKNLDRSPLENLVCLKEKCDEIIIVKNGFITDSSLANLIFFNGKNWFTPETPLLPGICRERLLDSGFIFEIKIRPEDMKNYLGVKLINAMRYPEESEIIPISQILKTPSPKR